ncbi:hypothetical protein [Streptomyces olivoreticuli]|uniref:hypothetical protein n=1 Tax=Streptomyces olivoreticuli TaxID=68246 RepID=UPI0013C2AE1B|nr:hypothetical protein [Streptomyces olivoreticuli]
MGNPEPGQLTLSDIASVPGLGREKGEKLARPNDERYVRTSAKDFKGRRIYTLSKDNEGKNEVKLPANILWCQKNYWYAPEEGHEEIWVGSARPEWYWETVATAVASYRKPGGSEDADLLTEGFRCVLLAVSAVLKVTAPEVLPGIADRVHFLAEDGIDRVLRIDSVLSAELNWDSVLPSSEFGQLGKQPEGETLLKRLRESGVVVHPSSGETSHNPAVSRARSVAVFKEIKEDAPPESITYHLALKADRHPKARRHLLAHELTHAQSRRGCGLQAESTDVDEAYTETLARMVTDTITAVELGLSGSDLKNTEKRNILAGEVQYNVYCEASRATEQEKGALRYQKNIWGLVKVSLDADPTGKTLSAPLTEQLARYLEPDAPALPVVLKVVAGEPDDLAVRNQAEVRDAKSVGGSSSGGAPQPDGSAVRSVAPSLATGASSQATGIMDMRARSPELSTSDCETAGMEGAAGTSRRATPQPVSLELFLPDTDEADYHLLQVHGTDGGRARTALIDGGCVGAADAAVHAEKLAKVLARLPRGSTNRPVLDLVLLTGDVPRRYNLLPAVTRDLEIGAVHYAGAPGRDKAPLPLTGNSISQWLTAHNARPFPAAYSCPDRPFATLGPAALQVLGANLSASSTDSAGGSAMVLVSAGGLRLVLTSDTDAAAAQTAAALCAVPTGPRLFTAPAALTVVSGRPDRDAARAWPWQAPVGSPLLLPVAATSDRPTEPGTPARWTAVASVDPKAQPLATVILQLPETTLTIPPPEDDGGSS